MKKGGSNPEKVPNDLAGLRYSSTCYWIAASALGLLAMTKYVYCHRLNFLYIQVPHQKKQ
jgi:hypothetical protein